MGEVAIRAAGLGKRYRIGQRQKYKALRDTLTDALYAPLRKARSLVSASATVKKEQAAIWALKDVSFEIKQGEVVGVIGRNGAGKSTLLKILSRITEPTAGFVDLHGRVGSLLEVGTGFHPELTGRENIYLNGSIIGMKKGEIDRKFDEIVAFAEIEQFLDTPVKFYSSGMYMRLGFSVAAHLEPEILLVDEVLAVGDATFQKKCLGKMGSVAKEGRTVLLVSHNIAAIQSLCQQCFLIENGQMVLSGSPHECIDQYLLHSVEDCEMPTVNFSKPSRGTIWMRSATVICNGIPATTLLMGERVALSVDFASEVPIRQPGLAFVIRAHSGTSILQASSRYQPSLLLGLPVCEGTIRCELEMVPFTAGRYVIDLYFGDQAEDTHVVENALSFEVVERDLWGLGQVPSPKVSAFWWPTTFRMLPAEGFRKSLAGFLPVGSSESRN
jgi:lipopolysaccharide transport system ATP-binding protein